MCRQAQTTTNPPNDIITRELLLLHSFPIVPIAGILTSIQNSRIFNSRKNTISRHRLRFTNGQMICKSILLRVKRVSLKSHLQKGEMCQKQKHNERATQAFSTAAEQSDWVRVQNNKFFEDKVWKAISDAVALKANNSYYLWGKL